MLKVISVPFSNDNYAYILKSGDDIAVLDPGESSPVISKLEEENLSPSFIFNTHHHADHINGNKALQEKYNARLIAAEKNKYRIANISHTVTGGDILPFGDETIIIMETPGHTTADICYFFPHSKILFTGDTLFSMGCGRPFEGTAEELFNAFEDFKKLPDSTEIYCGHEYTLDNAKFCLNIEPENKELIKRIKQVKGLREQGKSTLPTTIGLEKKTNVFMRCKDATQFKQYRALKDNF